MIMDTSLHLLPQAGFGGLFGIYPSILGSLQVAEGLVLLSTAHSQLACPWAWRGGGTQDRADPAACRTVTFREVKHG